MSRTAPAPRPRPSRGRRRVPRRRVWSPATRPATNGPVVRAGGGERSTFDARRHHLPSAGEPHGALATREGEGMTESAMPTPDQSTDSRLHHLPHRSSQGAELLTGHDLAAALRDAAAECEYQVQRLERPSLRTLAAASGTLVRHLARVAGSPVEPVPVSTRCTVDTGSEFGYRGTRDAVELTLSAEGTITLRLTSPDAGGGRAVSDPLPRRVPGAAWEELLGGFAWPATDPDTAGARTANDDPDHREPGGAPGHRRVLPAATGLPGGAEAGQLFQRILAGLRTPPISCPAEPGSHRHGNAEGPQTARRERACDSPRYRRAPRGEQ